MTINWKTIGINLGVVYTEWELGGSEMKTLREFLAQLGDRRVLFDKGCGSDRRAMIKSVEKIRALVTEALTQLDSASSAASDLEEIRSSCHAFQSTLEYRHVNAESGQPEEDLFIAVGEFRQRMRRPVASLAVNGGIVVADRYADLFEPMLEGENGTTPNTGPQADT